MFALPRYETVIVSNSRELHYMDLLTDAQKLKTFQELELWFRDQKKNIDSYDLKKFFGDIATTKHCKYIYSKLKKDNVSIELIPDDFAEDLAPVMTVGDGSCLYNAISIILTGNCQLKYELRLKTVRDLVQNSDIYDKYELNVYSAWESYEQEVLESIKKSTYSSLTHIHVLSNLLGCKIASVYPNSINLCVNRSFFNKTIYPIANSYPNVILTAFFRW